MTKEIQIAVGKMQALKFHSPICENIKHLSSSYEMDVMSVSKSDMVYEFEVKTSRSDFKADAKKSKWTFYSPPNEYVCPNYFSYACPDNMISIEEIPNYAGLYYFIDNEMIEIKRPKRLHKWVHNRSRILEKVCRLSSERQFLGCARLTYNNNLSKEMYEKYKNY